MAAGRIQRIVTGHFRGQHCVILFTRADKKSDEFVFALEVAREMSAQLCMSSSTPLDETAIVSEAERILAGEQE